MTDLNWKTGFEIELLAPRGFSRFDLADAVAHKSGGKAERSFYHLPERDNTSDTLVLGYNAYDAKGDLVARFVDDLAIQEDLDQTATATDGWYRIISNDIRLLDLIVEQCNPNDTIEDVLKPIARLYGVELQHEKPDTWKVIDKMDKQIAHVISIPGERERPCEIISAPITENHLEKVETLVGTARSWGFSVPEEAQVHVHFDATDLRDPVVFAKLVNALKHHGEALRQLMGTNTKSDRIGLIPSWLYNITRKPAFQILGWDEACEKIKSEQLTKNSDYNFINLVHNTPGKNTFEVRIFPGTMDAEAIIKQAALFEGIIRWCVETPYDAQPARRLNVLIDALPISDDLKKFWKEKL